MLNILSVALQVLPLVKGVVSVVDAAGKSIIPEVVAYAESLIPIARDLVSKVDEVRDQLPDDQRAVWDSVRSDWNASVDAIPWLKDALQK